MKPKLRNLMEVLESAYIAVSVLPSNPKTNGLKRRISAAHAVASSLLEEISPRKSGTSNSDDLGKQKQ